MRNYLEQLDASGQLVTVSREVDPQFELAAVTRAFQQQNDSAVLFQHVKGTAFPVLTNVFSSQARLDAIIGATDEGFCRRWSGLLDDLVTQQESTISSVDPPHDLITGQLSDLPLITYHSHDAGPYFTSAIYLARDPDSGVPNLSFHRSMFVNDGELRLRLGDTHHLAAYHSKAEARNEPLEAALLIGVAPELFMAASASIPAEASELDLAAIITGQPIETYAARTIDLEIPLNVQIVVEGRILPGIRRREGPFGEFLGYYVPESENPVFEVSAVYWRPEPVFHSVLCGSTEDRLPLQAVNAAKTFSHLNARLPGIIDVSCAPGFMNTTIQIDQQYEGHARQVLLAAFSADLDYNKLCVVVDADDDPHDMDEIIRAFVARGRVDRRVIVIDDVPGFYRDPHKDHWGRVGIDATRPFGREGEFEKKTIPGQDAIELVDYR